MIQFEYAIKSMINISDEELEIMKSKCYTKTFKKKDIVSSPDRIPDEIFFILKGIFRVFVVDRDSNEHTSFFALENNFIADYSAFLQRRKSYQTIQALEETETIVLPRSAVEWGYANLKEGEKLGRLVAEYYFIYYDNRIKDQYVLTPKQRYDQIKDVFPNIHNRVPQHMIASYLEITPIHLSRLKKDT